MILVITYNESRISYLKNLYARVYFLQKQVCTILKLSLFVLYFVGRVLSWVSWVFLGLNFFFCEYLVRPKFLHGYSWLRQFFSCVLWGCNIFLVGISWVQNFVLWVFRGSNFFLSLISWFKAFQLLAAWARLTKTEIQKYISNHEFFSKSISTIVNCLY